MTMNPRPPVKVPAPARPPHAPVPASIQIPYRFTQALWKVWTLWNPELLQYLSSHSSSKLYSWNVKTKVLEAFPNGHNYQYGKTARHHHMLEDSNWILVSLKTIDTHINRITTKHQVELYSFMDQVEGDTESRTYTLVLVNEINGFLGPGLIKYPNSKLLISGGIINHNTKEITIGSADYYNVKAQIVHILPEKMNLSNLPDNDDMPYGSYVDTNKFDLKYTKVEECIILETKPTTPKLFQFHRHQFYEFGNKNTTRTSIQEEQNSRGIRTNSKPQAQLHNSKKNNMAETPNFTAGAAVSSKDRSVKSTDTASKSGNLSNSIPQPQFRSTPASKKITEPTSRIISPAINSPKVLNNEEEDRNRRHSLRSKDTASASGRQDKTPSPSLKSKDAANTSGNSSNSISHRQLRSRPVEDTLSSDAISSRNTTNNPKADPARSPSLKSKDAAGTSAKSSNSISQRQLRSASACKDMTAPTIITSALNSNDNLSDKKKDRTRSTSEPKDTITTFGNYRETSNSKPQFQAVRRSPRKQKVMPTLKESFINPFDSFEEEFSIPEPDPKPDFVVSRKRQNPEESSNEATKRTRSNSPIISSCSSSSFHTCQVPSPQESAIEIGTQSSDSNSYHTCADGEEQELEEDNETGQTVVEVSLSRIPLNDSYDGSEDSMEVQCSGSSEAGSTEAVINTETDSNQLTEDEDSSQDSMNETLLPVLVQQEALTSPQDSKLTSLRDIVVPSRGDEILELRCKILQMNFGTDRHYWISVCDNTTPSPYFVSCPLVPSGYNEPIPEPYVDIRLNTDLEDTGKYIFLQYIVKSSVPYYINGVLHTKQSDGTSLLSINWEDLLNSLTRSIDSNETIAENSDDGSETGSEESDFNPGNRPKK